MGLIKFNRKQLQNPTPASVSFKINMAMAIDGAVASWIGSGAAPFIPAKVSTMIQSFLGLGILILLAIKPFFGVEPTKQSVPVGDVKEMEVKPEAVKP